MGMKSNSGFFTGTSGALKYKLDIQHFASKIFSLKGHVSLSSLKNHGQDLIDKTPSQVKNMMKKSDMSVKYVQEEKRRPSL